jgi:hypothetical protein
VRPLSIECRCGCNVKSVVAPRWRISCRHSFRTRRYKTVGVRVLIDSPAKQEATMQALLLLLLFLSISAVARAFLVHTLRSTSSSFVSSTCAKHSCTRLQAGRDSNEEPDSLTDEPFPSLEEIQRGKPAAAAGLEDVLRARRIGRLTGQDVEVYVEDDAGKATPNKLPDFAEFTAERERRLMEGGAEAVKPPTRSSKTSESGSSSSKSPLKGLFQEARKVTTEPKKSSDYFDYGVGGLVKKSVYACCLIAVAWEIYLNVFFERALPPAPLIF